MRELWQRKNKVSDEGQIRLMIDGFVKAFRAKVINGVIAIYAPEIVSFDLAARRGDRFDRNEQKVSRSDFRIRRVLEKMEQIKP